MARAEWPIQDIARATGTTSRTLRHYDEVGLLKPSRVGSNGFRYYDQERLIRLQRILLLRELGLSLSAIAEVLAGQQDTETALRTHLNLLKQERERIGRQIESVKTTLRKTTGSEPLMAAEMFDGFDHAQYKDEVTQRWGTQAWEQGDRWWRRQSDADKRDFQQRQRDIAADFARALQAGRSVDSDEVQEIAQCQYDWIASGWQGRRPTAEQFTGLGQMYVDDPRFAENYDQHGAGTAAFVRDAMQVYAAHNL